MPSVTLGRLGRVSGGRMTHQPQTARRRPPPSSGTSHCWKHKQLLGFENCLIAREVLFSRPLIFRQKSASGAGAERWAR